jgi:Protein of unknown function (DUF3082)
MRCPILHAKQTKCILFTNRPPVLFPCSGALQAAFFATVLYQLSANVDAFFDGQALPSGYTARNITISLRTIVQGLSYLITFIFAANFAGLTGGRLGFRVFSVFFYPTPYTNVSNFLWVMGMLAAVGGNARP